MKYFLQINQLYINHTNTGNKIFLKGNELFFKKIQNILGQQEYYHLKWISCIHSKIG